MGHSNAKGGYAQNELQLDECSSAMAKILYVYSFLIIFASRLLFCFISLLCLLCLRRYYMYRVQVAEYRHCGHFYMQLSGLPMRKSSRADVSLLGKFRAVKAASDNSSDSVNF